MENVETPKKKYDLEERLLKFARQCRDFIGALKKDIANYEYGRQLIRSSASIGANYIEANESFSKKDLLLRLKISKKEAKATIYWLNLVDTKSDAMLEKDRQRLTGEAKELVLILSTIIKKNIFRIWCLEFEIL